MGKIAGKVIKFCLIPSHINIPGNERADTAAKAALYLPITSMNLPASCGLQINKCKIMNKHKSVPIIMTSSWKL